MLRILIKDSVIYAVPQFVTRGLSLILVPLYTRALTPADYGSLDLLTVFSSIVSLTVALEVSQGLGRHYCDEVDARRRVLYASTALWFSMACYSAFALIMFLLSQSLSGLVMGRSGLETEFRIGIVYIWVNGIFCLVQNQFRWDLRSKCYAIVSLVMALVTAGTSILLTFVLRLGLVGLLIGMAFGCIVASGLGLRWLRNSFQFEFDFALLRKMLAFSAPLVISGIAVWVSLYVDRMMIKHFLSIEEVGLYGIGYRLASVVGALMVGFQGALTPLIYARYQNIDTPWQLARIFRIFLLVALMAYLALALFSADILWLLTTPAYYDSAIVVVYLVPAILLSNMYIFAPGIDIARKTKLIIWINLGAGLLNVALNFILIPYLGIRGAAMSTMISYLVAFFAYAAIGQRFYPIPHRVLPLAGAVVLVTSIAFGVPQLQFSDPVRWGVNLMMLCTSFSACVALGLVRRDELLGGLQLLRGRAK